MKHMKKRAKTHKRTKRLFSVLLTLAMIASIMPNITFAAGVDYIDEAMQQSHRHYSSKYVQYYINALGNPVQTDLKKNATATNQVSEIEVPPSRWNYYNDGYIRSYVDSGEVEHVPQNSQTDLSGYYNNIMVANYVSWSNIFWEDTEYSDSTYLDPINGNDENDGTSPDKAVKTFERAKEVTKVYIALLSHYVNNFEYPTIYLMNTYTLNSSDSEEQSKINLTLDGYGRTKIARYQGDANHNGAFTGVMFRIEGDEASNPNNISNIKGASSCEIKKDENGEILTGVPEPIKSDAEYKTQVEMYSMIIDGAIRNSDGEVDESEKTATAIVVDGAELTLSYGALVINNNTQTAITTETIKNETDDETVEETTVEKLDYAAGGIHVKKASSLIMNGGAISNCTCVGTDDYSGAGAVYVEGVSIEWGPFTAGNDMSKFYYSSGASFVMKDGLIAHNTGDVAALFLNGGGYYEIDGGYISNNYSEGKDLPMNVYTLNNSSPQKNKGCVVFVAMEGGMFNVGDKEYNRYEALNTPLYLNGGKITDNKAETVLSVPVLYSTGGDISYNERYNPTSTDINSSSAGNEPASTVIRTTYISTSGDNGTDFIVSHNQKFQSTIYVCGTVKMNKGTISYNNTYTAVPMEMASGLLLNHGMRDSANMMAYSLDAKVYTDISNVKFQYNTTDFDTTSVTVAGGGALFMYSPSTNPGDYEEINITDCEFKGNSTPKNLDYAQDPLIEKIRGGAIGMWFSPISDQRDENRTLNVTRTKFTDNYTAGSGGAVGNVHNAIGFQMNFTDCEFTGNEAAAPKAGGSGQERGFGGGAIAASACQWIDDVLAKGEVKVDGCTFDKNTAQVRGGAISSWALNITIDNSTFKNNTALYNALGEQPMRSGGAISTIQTLDTNITNSKFYGNSACTGGAYANDMAQGTTTITSCDFYNNGTYQARNDPYNTTYTQEQLYSLTNGYVSYGLGGAIFFAARGGCGNILLDSVNVYDNYAVTAGGGIHFGTAQEIEVKNSSIRNNEARYAGGGAIYANSGGSILTFDNTKVDSNHSAFGGGIAAVNGAMNIVNGTSITNNYISNGAYTTDVMTTELAGRKGGGLGTTSTQVFIGTNKATVEKTEDTAKDLNPVTISGNTADSAGAIYNTQNTAALDKVKITNNRALSGNGGGLYGVNAGNFTLSSNTEVSKNTAINGNGGGIYLANGTSSFLSGGKIIDNVADRYGGGVYTDGDGATFYISDGGEITGNETRQDAEYTGSAIYKSAKGYTVFNSATPFTITGDVRIPTENMESSASFLKLTTALPNNQSKIYISAPEDSLRGEGMTVSEAISESGKYIVAQCASEEIASASVDKFVYVGDGDYNIVVDEEEPTQLILEENLAPTRSFTVTHTWDDEGNQDGIRPENSSVIATLYANSAPVTLDASGQTVEPITLTGDNSTGTWDNMPKYDDSHNLITYSINMTYNGDEETPEGYVRTISKLTDGYLFNLKSKHTPEKITITANKIWNDELKSWETREQTPSDIDITLKADGVALTPDTINTSTNTRRWVYVWNDLPYYNDGKAIEYTLDEEKVPSGYSKEITSQTDEDNNITYSVTNTKDGWNKTAITDVEVNLQYPTDGSLLYDNSPKIASGSNYSIESYSYLSQSGATIPTDTAYNSGTEYKIKLTLVPNDTDTMEFASDVKTTVNIADNAPVTKSASISTDFDSITLEWTFKGATVLSTASLFGEAIRNVNCTINPPSQDRLPSYSAPTANGDNYTVGTVKWYNNDTATPTMLGESDRFMVGVPYGVQAQLKANTDYGFDFGETNINVNGNVRTNKAILQANSTTSDIVWYFDAITAETHKVTVEAENGTAVATPNESVTAGTEVAISDLAPENGYTTDDAEITVTRTGEETPIELSDDNTFTMPGADVTVKVVFNKIPAEIGDVNVEDKSVEYGYTDGNVLTAEVDKNNTDYTYTYQWYSTPYKGTDNGSKITGATEETYTVPTGKNAGEYYYYCIATATRKDNGETASNAGGAVFTVTSKEIENVSATIIDPVPEQKASSNTGAILPIGEKYVQSSSIVWKKDGAALGADDEFAFGTEYTAELTLEPISENYSFTNPVSGKVNDDEAKNIEPNEDGTVTLTYTVTTPEEPEPGVPYAVIANPEIVTYEYDSASLTAVVKNCDFDKYTYTYQWYDEQNQAIDGKNGAVTEDEQQLTLTLPTEKEVGVEKYYVAIAGTAKTADEEKVNGTSNNGAFVVQPKEITEITITGIDAPKYGETPDSDATIDSDEHYEQSGAIAWYNGENQISAFGYNTKYAAKINLAPKANYIFADTVTATVNGEEATVEIKENGNEAIVTYNGFSNTEAASEVSPSPSIEATVEPTTEATSTPDVTETTAPTSSPEVTETTEPTSSSDVTTSPSPSPTATTKVSRGGGGSGSVKTKATATPTVEPTTEPTIEPTSTPTDGNGSGNNGSGSNGNSGSGKGGHSTPELNKQDHFAYMAGYPDNLFMPDNSISRAEVTVMFSRLLTQKMDSDSDYTVSFPDIDADAWYKSQVGFMEQYGIIEGYEDGTFRPENSITRAEFAVIASKFDKLSDTEENVFSDVDDDYWATPYILLAHSNGWINGYEDGTFRPLNSITRAEVVSIVNRMLERSCDSEFVAENAENIVNYSDISDQHWAYLDILEASNAHLYEKNPDEVWTELIDKE
jgi:predicted outer membrane repeat protein